MNQIAMPPLTTLEHTTCDQASTIRPWVSDLPPLETATIPTFAELLASYQATLSKPQVVWSALGLEESTDHNALSQTNLARPQPISWLWHKRLPLVSFDPLGRRPRLWQKPPRTPNCRQRLLRPSAP